MAHHMQGYVTVPTAATIPRLSRSKLYLPLLQISKKRLHTRGILFQLKQISRSNSKCFFPQKRRWRGSGVRARAHLMQRTVFNFVLVKPSHGRQPQHLPDNICLTPSPPAPTRPIATKHTHRWQRLTAHHELWQKAAAAVRTRSQRNACLLYTSPSPRD